MTITPTFFFDLESKMRIVSSRAYDKLSLPENSWWNSVCKVQTIDTKKERLIWLLDTAEIGRPQASHGGGQQRFDEMVSVTQEREVLNALVDGLKIKREELEDKDANGLDQAAHWARQAGALFGYWPQLALSQAIIANPTCYDGVAFFHASHPYNPFDSTAGTFANILTGAASGVFPGACPIDESVALDVALKNLAKVVAYVSQIKTPNGLYPRHLRIAKLLVPPAMYFRAVQLTNAKFIAQASTGGAGSADVDALIRALAVGMPVEISELGSGFSGGSDTTYYVAVEDILNDELGAFTYLEREPFSIIYHGPQTDAQLAIVDEFQWTTRGRNVVTPGHPFMLYKCPQT
jgi:hypothetical protein